MKEQKNDIISITTYCDTKEKIDVLIDNINIIREKYINFDIAIHANYPLPEHIQKMVDHYFYEDLNIIFDDRIIIWTNNYFFNKKFNHIIKDFGFCVLSQIKNLVKYLTDYNRVMLINYDLILDDKHFEDYYNYYDYDLLSYTFYPLENGVFLILMSFNPRIFLKYISDFITLEKYLIVKNLPEQKMLYFIEESKINFKLLTGADIKDKINNYNQNDAYINEVFSENFIFYNENLLEIYLWGFYSIAVIDIILKIDNNEFKLINNNTICAFESHLEYYKNINDISIIKINDMIVNIPLKILNIETAYIEKLQMNYDKK